MKSLISILVLMFVYAVALAQTASPVPPVVVVAPLPWLDQSLAWLNAHMLMAVMAGGVVLHVVASLWPTSKAQSLLIWVNGAIEQVQKLLKWVSDYSDKLLQNSEG